jgi:hypothetical protein
VQASGGRGTNYRKIPPTKAEIQPKMYFVLQVKCPLTIDQSQPNLRHLAEIADVNFQGNPSNGSRDTTQNVFSQRVMCPNLFIDGNQIDVVCAACVESATYHFSGKYL